MRPLQPSLKQGLRAKSRFSRANIFHISCRSPTARAEVVCCEPLRCETATRSSESVCATRRACRRVMDAPHTTTVQVTRQTYSIRRPTSNAPSEPDSHRRHTSHPRNRTGGRCWRSFLARHHRRALCVIPATSHRTNRASSSNVLGQKYIIRYRSFGRPSKGGAVCRGDDPDVWRERRKRINAGADPLSRNSYARPSRRYMRRIF